MRIDRPTHRTTIGKGGSSAGKARGGAGFSVDTGERAGSTVSSAPTHATAGIDAILALQSVDDPMLSKKRAIRHGETLLDVLEEVKADLLIGRISEGRLNRMLALVSRARQASDAEIEALIEDIELRVHVELAKLGRFAG